MYKVTNIDKTTQKVVRDGQILLLEPSESIFLEKPPRESYSFKVEKKKSEKKKLNGEDKEDGSRHME